MKANLYNEVSGLNLTAAELEQLGNDSRALINAGVARSHYHNTMNAAQREKYLNDFYGIFNEAYFSNRLPEFKVIAKDLDKRRAWGTTDIKGCQIWIDAGKTRKRNDAAVLNTLLHECVHVFQWYVIKHFKRWHGREFTAWCKALNSFGWRLGTHSNVNPFN